LALSFLSERGSQMQRIMVVAICAALGMAAAAEARAQDFQETLGRLLQGMQGQEPRQDPRNDPRYDPRFDPRSEQYDNRRYSDRAPDDRLRALDAADRRLDAQQRQIDEDRRRIEAERRRLTR
jgi:hypothetical protein